LLILPVAALSHLIIHYLLPTGILEDPKLGNQFARLSLSAGSVVFAFVYNALYVAFGEEMFYRGLLAGILGRRLRFVSANLVQSIVFVVPHLVILTVFPATWPLVIFVPLLSGLIYGWLRLKSGSFLPAFLLHTLANTLAAVDVMK
jgi:membrane protease YdiL (CAAX protease family)